MSQPIKAIETGLTTNELNTSNVWVRTYRTANFTSIVPQVYSYGASWPAGVQIDMEISNDGLTWAAFSTAQTYTSNGVKTKLDIQGIALVRARLSWTSNAGTIRVIVYGDTGA